jgi:hypothetical protein
MWVSTPMTSPEARACPHIIVHSCGRAAAGRSSCAGTRPVPQPARRPRHAHRPQKATRPTACAGRGAGRRGRRRAGPHRRRRAGPGHRAMAGRPAATQPRAAGGRGRWQDPAGSGHHPSSPVHLLAVGHPGPADHSPDPVPAQPPLAHRDGVRGHQPHRRPGPTSPAWPTTCAATATSLPRCAATPAAPPECCHWSALPAHEPDTPARCRGPGACGPDGSCPPRPRCSSARTEEPGVSACGATP